MIFVPILLLNMLIAMMGNTYARVIEQSEKEWMKQWAKIVVSLERAVSQTDAKKYLEDYSISLKKPDDSEEVRGVMVIKSKSKTRAKQRKGAVSNWKRVGKVTLTALKKRGLTGEELRRIMWGRASISTPTKIPTKKKNMDPFGTDSGALSVAVDVMSFTQDIILCGDEPQIKEDSLFVNNPNFAKNARAPAIPGQTPIGIPSVDPTNKNFKDPLRELVLISEVVSTNDPNYQSNVKTLANQATVLSNVKEINVGQGISAAKAIVAQEPKKIAVSAVLFQNPQDIVNPEKEKEFLKKLEALEDTDGEDKPVLGKISLIRRAKSAVSRTSSAKKKSDEHPLFLIAWDEKIDDKIDEGFSNEGFLDDEVEVQAKMEQFQIKRKSSPDSESASEKPITIKKEDEVVKAGKFTKPRKSGSKSGKNK